MKGITWDGVGQRFYETGVDHCVLFRRNDDGTYQSGIAWNGITGITESPDGAEASDLWADNMKYATLYSTETFGGTIEAYTYPEEFTECDGTFVPIDGVYFGQQDRKSFALCYRTKVGNDAGLEAYKLHIIYNCKASPSEKGYETINDSPDAITFSWEFNTVPENLGGHKPVSVVTIDSSKLDERGLEKLAELEDMLYGGEETESALMAADSVLEMFSTYTGEMVYIKAHKSGYANSVKILNIEPIQSGEGDPSPDNIRPITGYNSVTIYRTNTEPSEIAPTEEGDIYTVTFPSSIGTVYGGKLDATAGTLSLTHMYITADGTNVTANAAASSSGPNRLPAINISDAPALIDSDSTLLCDSLKYASSDREHQNTQNTFRLSTNGNFISLHINDIQGNDGTNGYGSDTELKAAANAYMQEHPVNICYELVAPITYNISAQSIQINEGDNYLYAVPGTIEVKYIEGTGVATETVSKQQLLNLADPEYVKSLVRLGIADQVFDIGDQFNVTWNDGTNTYDLPFDVVHFGKVTGEDGNEHNGMYLQSHWLLPAMQFDASEAIYRVGSTDLAAGVYNFTFGSTWGSNVVNGVTWSFTLTQAVPAGGCIVVGRDTGDTFYTWGAPDLASTNWRVYTFDSLSSLTPIETATLTSGSSGTNLGTLSSSTVYSDSVGSLNNLQRAGYGYNRWSQSAVRQWLNSSADAAAWWTPQNAFDRPPKQLETTKGFMAGLPSNFIKMVQPIRVTTLLNTVSDSALGQSEVTTDLFALTSLEHEYSVTQVAGVEGEAFQYWIDKLGGNSPQGTGSENENAEHIRYLASNHSSTQHVRLRSPYRGYAYSTWYVHTSGYVYRNNYATDASALSPYCVIY